MNILPKALTDLVDAFGLLPGVGSRTAERYAYYLVRNESIKSQKIATALTSLHEGVKYCPITFALIDSTDDISPLYSDPKRNRRLVAVVAEPLDIAAIEKTNYFTGTYHVLGGLVSPIDGIGPDELHIKELVTRIKDDEVEEIILATNASVEGESTALYIQQQLIGQDVSISRLARGLPVGADLEYADQITLGRALENRQIL